VFWRVVRPKVSRDTFGRVIGYPHWCKWSGVGSRRSRVNSKGSLDTYSSPWSTLLSIANVGGGVQVESEWIAGVQIVDSGEDSSTLGTWGERTHRVVLWSGKLEEISSTGGGGGGVGDLSLVRPAMLGLGVDAEGPNGETSSRYPEVRDWEVICSHTFLAAGIPLFPIVLHPPGT
jgi:hypothetical protein